MHNRKAADSLTTVLTPQNTMLPKSQTSAVLLRPERSDRGSSGACIHAGRHAGPCGKALPCTGSLRFTPFQQRSQFSARCKQWGLFPAIPTHHSFSARPSQKEEVQAGQEGGCCTSQSLASATKRGRDQEPQPWLLNTSISPGKGRGGWMEASSTASWQTSPNRVIFHRSKMSMGR